MSALLLQSAIKASIVFTLTWVTTLAMRRHSAAARHLVWTLGISAALLLPVFGVVTPPLNISLPADPVVVAIPEAGAPLSASVSDVPSASAMPVFPQRVQRIALPNVACRTRGCWLPSGSVARSSR